MKGSIAPTSLLALVGLAGLVTLSAAAPEASACSPPAWGWKVLEVSDEVPSTGPLRVRLGGRGEGEVYLRVRDAAGERVEGNVVERDLPSRQGEFWSDTRRALYWMPHEALEVGQTYTLVFEADFFDVEGLDDFEFEVVAPVEAEPTLEASAGLRVAYVSGGEEVCCKIEPYYETCGDYEVTERCGATEWVGVVDMDVSVELPGMVEPDLYVVDVNGKSQRFLPSPTGDRVTVRFHSELDPDRDYCVSVSLERIDTGDVTSTEVCRPGSAAAMMEPPVVTPGPVCLEEGVSGGVSGEAGQTEGEPAEGCSGGPSEGLPLLWPLALMLAALVVRRRA